MTEKVFTFWEGKMPAYIDLCLQTWKFPFTILTYDNLHEYTDLPINKLKDRFTMPKIADCVRVHVLRDQGGYWLDADTIMITDKLPTTNMIGDPNTRMNTIGFLYGEKGCELFRSWSVFQDSVIKMQCPPNQWNAVGNAFTDNYVKEHKEVTIADVTLCWPETYMIHSKISRYEKYKEFYFNESYDLSSIMSTDMLMLHNSWTPDWYKDLYVDEVLNNSCTMSNILMELI